jgi:hypothetical protein
MVAVPAVVPPRASPVEALRVRVPVVLVLVAQAARLQPAVPASARRPS